VSAPAGLGAEVPAGNLAPAMPAAATLAAGHLASGRRHGRAVVARVAVVLVAVAAVVGVVVGLLIVWWVGLAAFVLVLAGLWVNVVTARTQAAEVRALRLVGPTRPADARSEARLVNLVEGLAPGAGLPRPRCLVAEDPSVNALALGRDPRHGCLVVTTGLLGAMSRMQLEAVVAHCLVRIRDGHTIGPTLAAALVGRESVVRRAAGDEVSADTDLETVALTRYPPGLIAALEAAGATGGPAAPPGASPALASQWLAVPRDRDGLTVRIGALEEL